MQGSQKKLKKPRAMRPSQIIPKWRGVQEDERIVDDEFAKVEDLPKEPVEFFEKILRLKPYPYQVKFLRDKSALKVLRWCRRAGKTTVMSGDDICFAANNPNSTILVIMPKFQQIKEIYFQGEGAVNIFLITEFPSLTEMDRFFLKLRKNKDWQKNSAEMVCSDEP